MAPPPGTLRVGRYFLSLLGIFIVLYALVFIPGQRHTPKLGIDLVGGVRVIFTAIGKDTNSTQMESARQIMEQRVNSTGVTGSTVQVQGGDQILILIPNGTGQDVRNLGAAAKLNFRGLVGPSIPVTCGKFAPAPTGATTAPSASAGASGSAAPSATTPSGAASSGATAAPSSSAKASPNDAAARPLTAPTTPASSGAPASTPAPAPSGSATPAATGTAPAKPAKCQNDPLASVVKSLSTPTKPFVMPTTDTAFDALPQAQQQQIQAAMTNFNCDHGQLVPDNNDQPYMICGDHVPGYPAKQKFAYLMGKVVVQGKEISSVSAQAPNPANGTTVWSVNLTLKSSGNKAWAAYTGAHNVGGSSSNSSGPAQCSASTTPCADFVAFTLNGEVLSSPVNQQQINGGTTQITGNFTESSANALARQLKFGSLPLTFRLEANQPVSATLGSSQLKAAFLAGGIGLILVVIYSLLYYRGLGLVTIASLIVSAGLVYASLVILGEHMGFTLDLAGITGFIVALGITADSFVVFFERIKDEVHSGRSMRVAVPRAWVRARRTILSADTVSFLAAAILYFFASADVQGFAFTLGLSTILDLVVVFLFTHPIVSLLSRSRTFGSPRFTGLDHMRAGGVVADEAPAPRRRPARRGGTPTRRSSTAVLERPEADTEIEAEISAGEELPPEELPAEEPVDAAVPTGESRAVEGTSEPADADDPVEPSDEPDEADRARKRTAPAPGTAAERAAARRARMRDKREQGDS